MVLIRHGEEKQRIAILALRIKVAQQIVHKHAVGVEHRRRGVNQLAEAAVGKGAFVKAEVFVHVLPVIEPAVAGMTVERIIALLLEVPDVGVGAGAEVLVVAVAGEEAPFGVRRAAGEDVCQEAARYAAAFQLVQRGVDLRHGGDIRQHGVVRQVAEGLKHDADDRDLLLFRDVRRLIRRKRCERIFFIITLRRIGEHLLHAVNERIDRALGYVDLHVRPGIDKAVVRGLPAADVRIGVDRKVRAQRKRKADKRTDEAREGAQRLLAHQKNGKEQHDDRARKRRQHRL